VTESETSSVPADRPATGADEELWLTYLNYDHAIQQAVRRLGALSTQNVEMFRGLLLKDRDRSRVKEYEAESIRRLQGEAFVGDDELQRTLIVLNAEDPRYGEELKRLVATSGKPSQLDHAVAAIRAGKQSKGAQAPTKDKLEPPPQKDPVRESVVVPLRREKLAAPPQPLPEAPEAPKRNLKPLLIGGAAVLAVALAAVFLAPRLVTGNSTQEASAVAIAPVDKAQEPAPVVRAPPAAETPAQADTATPDSPPLRPGSAQPETPASPAGASQPDVSPTPVAGAKYRVVRGDMLSDIALKVYGDASKFRMIQAANPSIRNKPDRILVDQVIFIPPVKP